MITTDAMTNLTETVSARKTTPPAAAPTGVVKILDFGLVKLAGTEGVTQTGTAVGTGRVHVAGTGTW